MKRPELYEAFGELEIKMDDSSMIISAFELAIPSTGINVTRPKAMVGGANAYTLCLGMLRSSNLQQLLLTREQLAQFTTLVNVMAVNYNGHFTKKNEANLIYNVLVNEGLI